ncbi:MAG: hypothetical protein ACQGVC_11775 [Myxococcota bacterium]
MVAARGMAPWLAVALVFFGCTSVRHSNPRAFVNAHGDVQRLYFGSYVTECYASVEESERIREILVLLQDVRAAVVETYGPEFWFVVEWRDGESSRYYAGDDWIAPIRTGNQDAISGWRTRSQSFQAALTAELNDQCFRPMKEVEEEDAS